MKMSFIEWLKHVSPPKVVRRVMLVSSQDFLKEQMANGRWHELPAITSIEKPNYTKKFTATFKKL